MMTSRLVAVGLLGVLLVAGCSSSNSESEDVPSSPANTTAPTETANGGAADGGCSVATVDGNTDNQELLALATQVYESMLPDVGVTRSAASAAGLSVSVDSAAGGTVMQLVQLEDRSVCNITVIDDLDAKTLSCGDL